jgi:hypothetical protein
VDQLLGDDSEGGAPTGVEFEFRGNPTGVYDVDVVHLTNSRAVIGDHRISEREQLRRARRFAKALKRRRVALVRMLDAAAEDGVQEASRAEALLDSATTSYLAMNPTIAAPSGRQVSVISHSHLRYRFLGYPRARSVPGRLLCVSPGVFHAAYEGPLKVFALAHLPDSTLRLVGSIPSALTTSFARTIARHSARVSVRDEALSDAARVEELTKAELVIVASPDSRESLSIMMLALSLDRPVLVEGTAATRLLADEVGQDWIRLHEGPLTAVTLESAVDRLRLEPPAGRPNLDARDPNAIAAQYAAVFRAAAAAR